MTQSKVLNLMVNYRKNPVGIDDPNPRLSWQIQAQARGFIQSAYQIQAGCDPAFGAEAGLVWDTGKVNADSSVHIGYEGETLLPRTRYYWRVRIWDSEDNASVWSEAAYWETGQLSEQNWHASWITAASAPGQPVVSSDSCDYFRTAFELPDRAVSARIYATSLGMYRLYINGVPADDTQFNPGWTSYNKRLQYQTYDVTQLLTAGENALGCIVGNGWYKGYLSWDGNKDHYGRQRAVLIQLHATLADGTEQMLISDGSWRTSSGPLLMSELYHGEIYDARLEMDGWASPASRSTNGSLLYLRRLRLPRWLPRRMSRHGLLKPSSLSQF